MLRRLGISFILFIAVSAVAIYFLEPEYSYIPPKEKVSMDMLPPPLVHSLSDKGGTDVSVTPQMIAFGRKAYYSETFGNEVFFTDIMGILDGPFRLKNVASAVAKLKGQGTTNLRVKAAETATIGGVTIHKGDYINTGLDVPKGASWPLGINVKLDNGKPKIGIGCIMCHAISDLPNGKVIEGVTNPDINVGLVIALATNSTAFFTHTDVSNLQKYMKDLTPKIQTSKGKPSPLPDPQALEDAVDRQLMKWPPGYVDTMIDLKNNPVQIIDSFTLGDHPYTWSGISMLGPFKGLQALSGIPNGQNMDALSQSEISEKLYGIDKELFMGTILQHAASRKFRYDPTKGLKPSEFFAKVDPTPGVPGTSELIPMPNFPNKVSMAALTGLMPSVPGYKAGEHLLGMAAYQNSLVPPPSRVQADDATRALGKTVFKKANCMACHAGTYFTNNRVIPSNIIGTNASRGRSLHKSGEFYGPNLTYSPDTPVPLPPNPSIINILKNEDPEQIKLALAHGDSPGGYKVPSLFGLYWSAPYLHDGGAAVGKNQELGIPNTLYKGKLPDPSNSLRALLDRNLRRKVIEANHADSRLVDMNIEGIGHEYWVDEANGFTKEQQNALILYLLKLNDK